MAVVVRQFQLKVHVTFRRGDQRAGTGAEVDLAPSERVGHHGDLLSGAARRITGREHGSLIGLVARLSARVALGEEVLAQHVHQFDNR